MAPIGLVGRVGIDFILCGAITLTVRSGLTDGKLVLHLLVGLLMQVLDITLISAPH